MMASATPSSLRPRPKHRPTQHSTYTLDPNTKAHRHLDGEGDVFERLVGNAILGAGGKAPDGARLACSPVHALQGRREVYAQRREE